MAIKKVPAKRIAKKAPAPGSTLISHRINDLLHTIRRIAQHEDELCTLLHASRSGSNTGLPQELLQLLDKLPSQEYTDDLDGLRELLPLRAMAAKNQGGANKKSAVSRPVTAKPVSARPVTARPAASKAKRSK